MDHVTTIMILVCIVLIAALLFSITKATKPIIDDIYDIDPDDASHVTVKCGWCEDWIHKGDEIYQLRAASDCFCCASCAEKWLVEEKFEVEFVAKVAE